MLERDEHVAIFKIAAYYSCNQNPDWIALIRIELNSFRLLCACVGGQHILLSPCVLDTYRFRKRKFLLYYRIKRNPFDLFGESVLVARQISERV